jgi:SAM-dependent methyltransferase
VDVARLFAQQGCSPIVCIDTTPYIDDAETDGVDYRAPETIEDTPLPAECFDVIYSHAALEHVSDPAKSVATIARLLRPGGVTSHVIDLRDHRDFDNAHAFLGYPEWLWRMSGNNRGWPNRWRASDWSATFEAAGLDTEVTSTVDAPLPSSQKLARRFAGKDRADLEVVGILVVASKPR